MKLIRDLRDISNPFPGAVLTIGNFDGIHLGHREIFRRIVRRAAEINGTSVVFTFVPHPLKLLAPDRAPRLISTYSEKERLIEASCVDVLICAPFTREFASLSASSFVEDILVRRIGIRHLVVGYDYAFGRNREGNVPFLRGKGEEFGFDVEVLEPITDGRTVYSSTRIRQMLEAGKVEEVVPLLGRHFNLEGTVVPGAGRGKGLGFPTANLRTEKELLPAPGVYAVKVRYGDTILDGVANIGSNPTFGDGEIGLEVHLLNFHREIYGESLRIYFLKRLRAETKFPSVQTLVEAIGQDIREAASILSGARIREYRDYLDCGMEVVEKGKCR